MQCVRSLTGATGNNVEALKVALEDPPVHSKEKHLKVRPLLWVAVLAGSIPSPAPLPIPGPQLQCGSGCPEAVPVLRRGEVSEGTELQSGRHPDEVHLQGLC